MRKKYKNRLHLRPNITPDVYSEESSSRLRAACCCCFLLCLVAYFAWRGLVTQFEKGKNRAARFPYEIFRVSYFFLMMMDEDDNKRSHCSCCRLYHTFTTTMYHALLLLLLLLQGCCVDARCTTHILLSSVGGVVRNRPQSNSDPHTHNTHTNHYSCPHAHYYCTYTL